MSVVLTETQTQNVELDQFTTTLIRPSTANEPASRLGESDEYPKGLRLGCIATALILSIFLFALDSTIISTLIPEMTNAFGSLNQVSWYGSAYATTSAAFLSLWGKAYTYFDLKKTFVFCVSIFEIGNMLCGFATGSPMLILGRVIAGVGGSGSMTGCFIIIAYAVKPHRRALYMGTLGVTFAVASVTCPLLGGLFVDQLSWRWGFWINVPFAIVATTMMTLSFKTPRHVHPRPGTLREKALQMDIGGVTILLAVVACFIFSMHYLGTSQGWTNKSAILFLASSIILTSLFVLEQLKMKSVSMIRIDLLTRRNFTSNCIYVFFLAGLYFPHLFSLPLQFQSVDNETASGSGFRLIPLVCGISIFTMLSNYIVSRYPQHTTLLTVGGLLGILGATLISATNNRATTPMWIISELIAASGIGIALQIPLIANQASVPASNIPTATSTTLFFETIGQALFTAAGEAAFLNKLIKNLGSSTKCHVDVDLVIRAGATGFRKVVASEQIPFVLESYIDALRVTYLMTLGCAAAAAAISFWMIWPMFRERVLGSPEGRNRCRSLLGSYRVRVPVRKRDASYTWNERSCLKRMLMRMRCMNSNRRAQYGHAPA